MASVAAAAALGVGAVVLRRWRAVIRYVEATSRAIAARRTIDEQFRARIIDRGALRLSFAEQVGSKARFDRFDLAGFLLDRLDEIEEQVRAEVEYRHAAARAHADYSSEVERVGNELLGTTRPPDGAAQLDQSRFDRVERKRFARGTLKPPTVTARVIGTVSYTSPKGRNSYRRRLEWDFDDLVRAVTELGHRDERRSRVDYERRAMTTQMRVDVLRRDGHRCQMCGRGARDTELHVDHITPVSRGGRTTMENLQTLCRDCNLGKSNRFVG